MPLKRLLGSNRAVSHKGMKLKVILRRGILVFLCSIITFTVAMPGEVMAWNLFGDNRIPPSVLSAEKVDVTKAQVGHDPSVNPELTTKKEDKTIDREDESKRTTHSSTYINKDGTKTYERSVRQKNYRNGDKWEKIDNRLSPAVEKTLNPTFWQAITNTAPAAEPAKEFTGKAGKMGVRMMPLSKGIVMSVGDKNVVMKPVGSNDIKPEKKNDSTTIYKNAWKGVDLEYQTEGELVKENIVIKQKDVATEYEFNLTGAKLIDDPKNPGHFTIKGVEDGYRFGGLTLALNDRGPVQVPAKSIKQERTSDNSIKVSLDKKWLESLPASSFPMVIDPSFGRWNNDSTDRMFKSDGYACTGVQCWIQAGTLYDNGWKHWRSYVHIPYPELAGKKVLGANVHAYYYPHANPDPNQRYLFFGHANCIGWECRGKHLATVLTAGDFDVNVTDELQLAVNAGNMGATWSFWGEEVPYKTFKTYSNMSLSVVYDTPTPVATPASPADKQVTVNTQPTLKVNPVSDGDGEAVKYYYRVSTGPDAETGAVINSGWTPTTQWTVPDGILQDGTTYYWHVYTQGGQTTSPNWVRSFKVDLRTGKDSTQAYETVGPMGIDLATGNATTGTSTHTMNALGGSMGLNLNYDSPAKSSQGLIGEYWNVPAGYSGGTPTDQPSLTRNDKDINFTWLNGNSPSPGTINNDWFYGRWKGYFVAPVAGSYSFGASQDDSVSIKVNGQNFSGCYGSTPCYNGAPITLEAGQVVPLDISYTEATGDGYFRMYVKGPVAAQIVPSEWLRTEVQASAAQYGLAGRYYTDDGSHNIQAANNDSSRLMMARNDSNLAFNWGNGGPASGLQTDNFMAKWTGYITVPKSGSYTLGAISDDGVRIKLNNGLLGAENTVMNVWQPQGAAKRWGSATNLTAGQQIPITVEYFEVASAASLELWIKDAGGVEQQIPAKWLTPKASVLPDAWRLGVDVDGNVGYERLRVAGTSVILEDSTRATHEYTWTGSGYKPPVNEDGHLTRNADNTFTLIDTDGRTYVFDAEGKLKSLTSPSDDRNPASLQYEYSGDPSRLMKIVDGVNSSRFATLHYMGVNEDGNCSVPSGFDGAPDGMLCAFKTSDGPVTKLYYKAGQLSRVEKPGSDFVDFGYDSFGRITSTRDSLANDAIAANVRPDDANLTTEITYDQLGRVNAIKAPAPTVGANRINHTFEFLSGATQLHTSGVTEPNGFSKRVEYDSLLRTTKETDIANLSSLTQWDPVKDMVLSKTDATGLKTTSIYDQLDRATDQYGAAPAAWFGSDRHPLAAYTNQIPHTQTGFDEGINGLAVSVFNNTKLTGTPKLYTTSMNQMSEPTYTLNLTNPTVTPTDGLSMRATGKMKLDQVGTYAFRFHNGGGARLYIDGQRKIDNWTAGNERFSAETTFTNTTPGQYISITVEANKAGTSGSGENGRIAAVLQQKTPGQSVYTGANMASRLTPAYNLTTSQTAYDSEFGNVTSTTSYSKPEYGLATSTAVDPSGLNLQASATFEAPGSGFLRQTGRTLPGGTSYSYSYYGANDSIDNPCTAENDPAIQAGATKGKTETDPDGSGAQVGRTTETVYDTAGNTVATRFNNDPWTCITYDNRGRQTSSTQPTINDRPGRTINTHYAADGNPMKQRIVDSVAGTSESEVDILGRTVTTKDVWGNDYALSYDNNGNITQKTGPLGTESYTYDAFFRPTSYMLDSTTLATITYDSFGRLATVTYPEAKDSANNMLKLTQVTRDDLGRNAGVVYTTSDGKTFDETVVWSQLGRITNATQAFDGQTLNSAFSYDKAGRLTSGTIGQTKFDYGYNEPDSAACDVNSANNVQSHKNSNRTAYVVTNLATNTITTDDKLCYNFADQLTSSTDASIGTPTYDDHGNTISFSGNGTSLAFGYDASDYNTSVEQGTKRTEYVKTATGDVLRKKEFDSGNLTSSYRYVAGGAILQACSLTDDDNCSTIDRYLTLPGNVSLTLSPASPDVNKQTVYSLHNYHGDTALTLTAEGKTTTDTNNLLAYGPFGEQLIAGTQGTATATALNASDSTMGWAANPTRKQEGGYTTSFIQMGARVYIPSLGRFLQVDPVDGGTLNGYVYAADPINSSDYSGQWSIGGFFASIVKAVRAVVKAVVTPVKAVARAVVKAAKVISNVVSPPRRVAAASSGSGGSRAGASGSTVSARTKPAFQSGLDAFDFKFTQLPRLGEPAVKFNFQNAIGTAHDYYHGGGLVGGVVGCGVGGVSLGAGGFAVGGPAGAAVGAGAGCLAGGRPGADAGGVLGAGVGFVLGGFGLPGQHLFDWGPDQIINPFKF